MMSTSYGLRYDLVTEFSSTWSAYDRVVAVAHMSNYGHIVVDTQYGTPIDNEHDLYVIEGIIKAKEINAGN